MARSKPGVPTGVELAILKVIWQRGPSTVREVLEVLNRGPKRAYTTVMTIMSIMAEKGLLKRRQEGLGYVYEATQARERTLRRIVGDVVDRAFDKSAAALVEQLLARSKPSEQELEAIRQVITKYREERGGGGVAS